MNDVSPAEAGLAAVPAETLPRPSGGRLLHQQAHADPQAARSAGDRAVRRQSTSGTRAPAVAARGGRR